MMNRLKIATSQFPVSNNIRANTNYILEQMSEASHKACDVIHFPECSLSGYAGVDFDSFAEFDWELLKACSIRILEHSKACKIWTILGSTHRLRVHKPHNSIYIINSHGEIVDRYDKRFCAGDDTLQHGDLAHYSSGDHFSIFDINGVRCSTLICHDYRYPELYRELKLREVEVVFHSYHAGNMSLERQSKMEQEIGVEYHHLNPGKTYPEITMPATMISYASNNYVWISCSNTSATQSCWGAFVVRADGVMVGRLEKNKKGILVQEIDTTQKFYDSTYYWRNRAIKGEYYSGDKITDERSEERCKL